MKTKLLLAMVVLTTHFFYAQNLVAYYPFNGNADDESSNSNNGTVNGATLTTDRNGNTNSAYSFNGTNQYITIPNNENINIADGESYSVSFWLKHNAQNNGKYMISKYATLSEPSYAIGTGSDGDSYSWYGFSNSFDTGIESRGSIDLNDNEWHQIASVFKSGESVTLYVDGVLDVEHTVSHTGSITNSRDLTIGCNADLSRFYNGYIDDIKIYNKALTATEIQNLYNTGTLGITDNQLELNPNFYLFNNTLYFGTAQNLSEIKNISIYNILAQKVYKSTEIQNELTLDFLDQGIYILKIELNNGKVDTKKFLIQ